MIAGCGAIPLCSKGMAVFLHLSESPDFAIYLALDTLQNHAF